MRLAPEVRRGQLLSAARELVLAQGYLPLRLDQLAERAGASKSLIYAYFPDQHALFNALLEEDFDALWQDGMEAAARLPSLAEAALSCSRIYFEHVAGNGPLAHIILRDPYMERRLAPPLAARRDRVMRALARLAGQELRLGVREAVAAANMLLTIPEEAGRIAYAGELPVKAARELCVSLVPASIKALRTG